VIALAASLTLHGPAVLVVGAGLLLAAAYSLPPLRISGRGVIAPMLLPLGYVAVPYLVGLFAVRGSVGPRDLLVLAGLYAGFIGRIILKDFRDVRGDSLFGKRTFLVRHGRGPTCVLSAVFWVAGASVLLAVRDRTVVLTVSYAAFVVLTLGLLRVLSRSTNARRDEALISAIAIVGRGVVVTLFAHFAMTAAHWTMAAYAAVMAAMVLQFVAAALRMARIGPLSRTVLHAAAPASDLPAVDAATVDLLPAR
jgi:4-hydroxybenzoate polyprenyltransferase